MERNNLSETSSTSENPPVKEGSRRLYFIKALCCSGCSAATGIISSFLILLYLNPHPNSYDITLPASGLIMAAAGGLVVGFSTAYFLSRWLTAPMLSLLTQVLSVQQGKAYETIDIDQNDEIGQLAKAFNQLNLDLEDSYRQVANKSRELMQTARQSGMAEVTVGVLHNVGNVLNSLGVTTAALRKKTKKSRISAIKQISELLDEQAGRLDDFFNRDERGRQLPGYFRMLAAHLEQERSSYLADLDELERHLNHTSDIVNLHQAYSRSIGLTESVFIGDIINDALNLNKNSLNRHRIHVDKFIEDLPTCLLDRHKVMQIVSNLISNAKDALVASDKSDRIITISINRPHPEYLRIEVQDNGMGITRKNLRRIFSYGFTTRKEGHGYGLHSGALAAQEMHGTLQAGSDGPGSGATFTLELPFRKKENDA